MGIDEDIAAYSADINNIKESLRTFRSLCFRKARESPDVHPTKAFPDDILRAVDGLVGSAPTDRATRGYITNLTASRQGYAADFRAHLLVSDLGVLNPSRRFSQNIRDLLHRASWNSIHDALRRSQSEEEALPQFPNFKPRHLNATAELLGVPLHRCVSLIISTLLT